MNVLWLYDIFHELIQCYEDANTIDSNKWSRFSLSLIMFFQLPSDEWKLWIIFKLIVSNERNASVRWINCIDVIGSYNIWFSISENVKSSIERET